MREYIILYPRNEDIEKRIIKVVMINWSAQYLIAGYTRYSRRTDSLSYMKPIVVCHFPICSWTTRKLVQTQFISIMFMRPASRFSSESKFS